MHLIKTTSLFIHTGRTGRIVALFFAVFLLSMLAVSGEVTAAGRLNTYGTLTSIENDGTVFIDKVGYFVSPLVTVRNFRDESIGLSNIRPPQRVYFEYEHSDKGFVIIFIREIAG